MSIINIISAIGNNSSIYPLLVRDCGIEIPTKVGMTYNQNLKDSKDMANNALRERLIDEYSTSAIWIGGIPLIDFVCNKIIRKMGYNPDINPKLFKESQEQGVYKNIDKFKNIAPEEVKELKKVISNKKTYERLLAGKFVLSTAIPVALMGFFLPKANFKLTEKIRNKKETGKLDINNQKYSNSSNTPSFKGLPTILANMSTVNKMAVTDVGLTVGRVTTARNKYEKMEMAFKMGGMMFLNFVAPIWIAKCFDALSNKLFKTDANLDPKIMADKDFLNAIKKGDLNLPKDNFIDYLDNNPNSIFSKLANKYCGKGKYYINQSRDPRTYVDTKKLKNFSGELEKFYKQAVNYGDIDKFAKKAIRVKSGNIIANVALSSLLLAVGLPKLTFILRKKITGSDAEPGLVKNEIKII